MKNIDEKILMAEEEIKQLQNKRKKLISHLIGETIDQITKNNTGKQTAVAGTKWNRLAYENFTINEVKEIMKKKDGKQMTDKEIVYLLKDILNKAKEKDPNADKSQYWELGNKEAVQAINETLKEHNISEKNIIEFMKTSKNKVIELIQEDLKLEEEYKLKLAKYKKDGTSTLPMVYVYGIRIRSPKLEEECEHSDLYEAEKDLKRNLEKTLSENMKNRFIKESIEMKKTGPLQWSASFIGKIYAKNEEIPISYKLLNHSLLGLGKKQVFYSDSELTKNIKNSDVFKDKVRELAENLNNGESKAYYSSLDYNDDKAKKDEKYAYGKVKLAIEISKDNNGNISYKGIVGDTYNFELHIDAYKNDLKIAFLNNIAYFVQKHGAMIPYNWTSQLEGTL